MFRDRSELHSAIGPAHVALEATTPGAIASGMQTGHMIPVESPSVIDPATNTISFDYWTWDGY